MYTLEVKMSKQILNMSFMLYVSRIHVHWWHFGCEHEYYNEYVYCHLDSRPTLVHPIHFCEQLVSLTNCGFVIAITHPLRSTRNGNIVVQWLDVIISHLVHPYLDVVRCLDVINYLAIGWNLDVVRCLDVTIWPIAKFWLSLLVNDCQTT